MNFASNRPDTEIEATLASVKAAGLRRRRARRTRWATGLTAVAAVGAVLGAGLLTNPAGEEVSTTEAATESPIDTTTSSTVVDLPTTTALPTEVLGIVIERPEGDQATTSTTAPRRTPPRRTPSATAPPTTAATVPAPVCPSTTDPACGEFRWSPAPAANQPLSLVADAVAPLAPGADTVITVHWSDGDATLRHHDDDTDGTLVGPSCSSEVRYGAWAPPAPAGGAGTFEIAYTAPAEAGTYEIQVLATTGSADCQDPYRSVATITVPITVS